MKTNSTLALTALAAMALAVPKVVAQETVVVEERSTIDPPVQTDCKTYYYSGKKNNWFIQAGAGIMSPFMENYLPGGSAKHHITATYNIGFGKWFSPYIGWRLGFNGGSLHWDNNQFNSASMVNANFDFMWDMFNTFGGVNTKRVFSIVPFAGLGGAFMWNFSDGASTIARDNGKIKRNSWALPLSAGLQFRFRLSSYADFFVEGRAQFAGDNWNNEAEGAPVDINLSALGGFTFYIGGTGSKSVFTDGTRSFGSYNPCEYNEYIANLNGEVNELRAALATTTAALAVAESQLPCPEIVEVEAPVVVENAPLLSTVRFTINSAKISSEEMVNVYNMAQYLKANPEQSIVIVGYADKDTGTSAYNMSLSKRRAEAVRDALVNKFGINPDRLSINAEGSDSQPYDVNNWNRIVIFANPN